MSANQALSMNASTKMELENIQEASTFRKKVKELLESNPRLLIRNLRHLITYGEEKCRGCRYIIDFLMKKNKTDILEDQDEDQTVLHLAATFHTCDKLVLRIASACPQLTSAQRTGEFEGQTFLHILTAKGACQAFTVIQCFQNLDESKKQKCISAKATGSKFVNTMLMGETVLSAAALNFNEELFRTLFEFGASVKDQNSRGETVLHTLIRYVHANKDYLNEVLEHLDFLQSLMLEPKTLPERRWGIRYTKTVWFTENNEHQTPLQLAACLGEDKIFTYIMNLQWVYRVLYDYDGLFDNNKYDITEVDTLAKLKWLNDKSSLPKWSGLKQYICDKESVLMLQSSPAVLDTVCQIDIHAACRIIQSPVLQTLLENKWKYYQRFFFIWALLHFFGSITLSVYAHYKIQYNNWFNDEPKLTSENGNTTQSINSTTEKLSNKPDISQSHELFVMIFGCLLLLPALLFLFLEYVRTFVQRRPWNLLLVHHNGTYRLVQLLLYLCFLVDSTWFLISPSTNPKLIIILAVLLSWFFMTFFLRPYQTFSFYTVMLQKVLIGDMLRFSAFILLELVSFTVVMQMLFLHNQPVPGEFQDFFHSMLTMFKLMLGLADLEILNEADPEWLAILLFVTYILITYVLIMNSLIAMMSNTCSSIELDKINIWQIQRLSVILFMEHLLMFFGLGRTLGKRHHIVKFMNEQETRYVIEVSQGPTPSIPGPDIAEQRRYMGKKYFANVPPQTPESSLGNLFGTQLSQGLAPPVRGADIARQRNYMREENFDDDLHEMPEFSAEAPELPEEPEIPFESDDSENSELSAETDDPEGSELSAQSDDPGGSELSAETNRQGRSGLSTKKNNHEESNLSVKKNDQGRSKLSPKKNDRERSKLSAKKNDQERSKLSAKKNDQEGSKRSAKKKDQEGSRLSSESNDQKESELSRENSDQEGSGLSAQAELFSRMVTKQRRRVKKKSSNV